MVLYPGWLGLHNGPFDYHDPVQEYAIVRMEGQRPITDLPIEWLRDSIHYTHHHEEHQIGSGHIGSSRLLPVHSWMACALTFVFFD
jgi:hypothetical protein